MPGGTVSHSGLQAAGKRAPKGWLPPSPLNKLDAASLGQQDKKRVCNWILQNVGAEIGLLKANAGAAPPECSHARLTGITGALKWFQRRKWFQVSTEEESTLNY